MRINFELDDLAAFLAVMETGTFHGAASRLNLSQPAVSRRIQKLEHALGSNLFERTTRSVIPTLAAKRLQARAEVLMDDASDIVLALRDDSANLHHQRRAIVTVATVPTVVSRLLSPALDRLAQEGTPPRIRLLDLSANDTAIAVSTGEADFGVCSLPSLEPNTAFEPLFEEVMVLAMRSDHPLASLETVHPSALVDEKLILPARGTGNRLLIDETIAHVDPPLRWSFEVNRTSTALELVAAGIGLAFLPASSLEGAATRPIVWRPVADMVISRPVGILTRRGKVESRAAAAFRRCIREVAQSSAA